MLFRSSIVGGKAHECLCVLNYERKVEHGSVVSTANKKKIFIFIVLFDIQTKEY